VAAAVGALLVAFAGGYGYHRDELYFVAAGNHLAWGYADQGPLTPLLARAMTEIAPGSLTVLRLPSALAAAATVLLAGGIARELGGSRRAQTLAAACVGVSSLVLFTGHLLSTSTFDLLVWTAVVWLVVRIVRTGEERLWLPAGLVMGIGLLNKPLPAFLSAGLVAGLLISGPRRMLRSPYLWAGAALALVIWTPWLVWQADHGWPQLDVARSLSNGNSTSSQPWWAVVPFQALLASPPLAPVWIAGLVWLARERELRFLAWAWAVLAVVFMASGGKPYYLGGLLPLLLAAGAVGVDGWLRRGRPRARAAVLGVAIGASAIVNAVIALPLLPARDSDPVVAVNGDVGETIGWPEFARTVARVHRGLPPRTVVFTSNYGEAGAIDRYGPALGIPGAWSGHNAYGQWGPPADGSAPVITVGFDTRELGAHFAGCTIVAHIDNREGVDNDERGAPVAVCRAPRRQWSQEWHSLRRLG
jgi:4-amino-4-deoxy-L-arabinose transferase-like glycosyltransferase